MTEGTRTTYRIIQLGPPREPHGLQGNEPVPGFDNLVTHHPGTNRNARMEEGVIVGGERHRAHAYVGGRLEEVEHVREVNGRIRQYGLSGSQVLLKKDFILEHPERHAMSDAARGVDVPSPVSGHIGARRDAEGLVEILDRPGGEVIARVRHMRDIDINAGDPVRFGQSLGKQGRVGTGAIHVHMEMDTRYYQQFRNYVDDLASGRLPVESRHREGVLPRPVVDDGTFRLGESSDRIRDLQRVMDAEGYRAQGGRPLDQDGVYRPRMQGALLDFQRNHGLAQTGDVDPATLQFAPSASRRQVDRLDHTGAGAFPAFDRSPPVAPGHPDHPDHRPRLPEQPDTPLNQRRAQASGFVDPHLARLVAALEGGDDAAISRTWADFTRSPAMHAFLVQGQEALAAQERRQQEMGREVEAPVLSRG